MIEQSILLQEIVMFSSCWHSTIGKLLSSQVTNYLKQSARLKGHKNIKGWKIYDNCKLLTFGLFQKRSFLKMENLTMPPTISYLQLAEIWASKSVYFSIASYCWGNFIRIHVSRSWWRWFQPEMRWSQWQLNWGFGNKGLHL